MGAGSPGNPVGLDPFRNIVNVHWPGRYIAFKWNIGATLASGMYECPSPVADPGLFTWFQFLVQWQWTIRQLAWIDESLIFETRNNGKTWSSGGSRESYNFAGAPGAPIVGQVDNLVDTIGVADWTWIGTTQPAGAPSPPNRTELIPNGSLTKIPIPDPTTAGSSHPTERFYDATNLIVEVDRVPFVGSTDYCRPWPVSEGAPGLGHNARRRELATGASRAAALDGQFDCSSVEASPDGERYVAHGWYHISGFDFWFLLKRAPVVTTAG